jgi:hypothetical protein
MEVPLDMEIGCISGVPPRLFCRPAAAPSRDLTTRSPPGRRVPVMGGTSLTRRCQTAGTTASGILAPRGALATGSFPGRNFTSDKLEGSCISINTQAARAVRRGGWLTLVSWARRARQVTAVTGRPWLLSGGFKKQVLVRATEGA